MSQAVATRIHAANLTDLVEETFFRIQRERMADVPILNPALSVEVVDFQRWQGHWLGVLVTPWCMSVILVPGQAEGWASVGDNQRRFVHFPAGDFAFLGSEEEGLGEFQSCALFSPMDRFTTQADAVLTARASLIALLQAAATEPVTVPEKADAPDSDKPAVSASRRRFFLPFAR